MARVLVIGDTHCPGMREDYVEFLRDTYRAWKCDRVVHIGDLADFHAISFHTTENGTRSGDDEVQAARGQIKSLYKAFPQADWMLGNHDVLPSRRVAEIAGWPSGFLRSYTDFWGIPGWTEHPRYSHIEIDGVLYSHGEVGGGGQYPAILQANRQFRSCVIGHFHSAFGVHWVANQSTRVFGASVGCGVDWELLQFAYGRKMARKPVVGCGVVIDGEYAYCEPMRL